MNNISLFSSQLTIVNVKENTDYVKSIDFEFLKTNTYFKSYMSKDHKVLNKFPFLKQIILIIFISLLKILYVIKIILKLLPHGLLKSKVNIQNFIIIRIVCLVEYIILMSTLMIVVI